jgi:hypothetical protein
VLVALEQVDQLVIEIEPFAADLALLQNARGLQLL